MNYLCEGSPEQNLSCAPPADLVRFLLRLTDTPPSRLGNRKGCQSSRASLCHFPSEDKFGPQTDIRSAEVNSRPSTAADRVNDRTVHDLRSKFYNNTLLSKTAELSNSEDFHGGWPEEIVSRSQDWQSSSFYKPSLFATSPTVFQSPEDPGDLLAALLRPEGPILPNLLPTPSLVREDVCFGLFGNSSRHRSNSNPTFLNSCTSPIRKTCDEPFFARGSTEFGSNSIPLLESEPLKRTSQPKTANWRPQQTPPTQPPLRFTRPIKPSTCKKWHNLNVVLPLIIPNSNIMVTSGGNNSYVFPDSEPSHQLLFSSAAGLCDTWATCLRLRVAVVHKCPEFLVSRVVDVFNSSLLEALPQFDAPIHLSCGGIVKHTIQTRSTGGFTYRYDTMAHISDKRDQNKLQMVLKALTKVSDFVNYELKVDGCKPAGLEFRFSPCRELKIALRDGQVCEVPGVNELVQGGGADTVSTWASQFTVPQLFTGEVRLEKDKTNDVVLDPYYLPDIQLKTRAMPTGSNGGDVARAVFVKDSVMKKMKPAVIDTNLTPRAAASKIFQSEMILLNRLLPSRQNQYF